MDKTLQNTRRRPKKGRPPQKQVGNLLLPLTHNMAMKTFRDPGMPSEMDIKFVFPIIRTLAQASPNTSQVFTPNSLWDVDPLFGTTNTPKLAAWSAFYNTYRVVAFKYNLSFSSEESFAVDVFTLVNDTDPGTSMTLTDANNAGGKWAQLGLSPNTKTLSAYHTVSDIVGSKAVEFDDKYAAGTTGSNPGQLVWLGIGAQSSTGANLTNGVSVAGMITMFARLSGRNIINS